MRTGCSKAWISFGGAAPHVAPANAPESSFCGYSVASTGVLAAISWDACEIRARAGTHFLGNQTRQCMMSCILQKIAPQLN